MVEEQYEVHVSGRVIASEWDAFLAEMPGGLNVQSSLWARVKALAGWRAVRFTVTRAGRIVAGAQILFRLLAFGIAAGYVPRGPVLAFDDPELAELVLGRLHQVARAHRIQYLIVQPPGNSPALVDRLSASGSLPGSFELVPTATVLVDLGRDLDSIMAALQSKTRYNIRVGQRKGVAIRQGTADDLGIFYRLHVITGRRHRFPVYPERYFCETWRILHPGGHIKLFIAEWEGEPLSAQLLLPFGDTVKYWRGAWSGECGNLHPNEAMHWNAIAWAKSQGYRYYDFDGINRRIAARILEGENHRGGMPRTIDSFKLGFGGQVTLYPPAREFIYSRAARSAYVTLFPRIRRWQLVARAKRAIRGTRT